MFDGDDRGPLIIGIGWLLRGYRPIIGRFADHW